jgi:hypothetical protein
MKTILLIIAAIFINSLSSHAQTLTDKERAVFLAQNDFSKSK